MRTGLCLLLLQVAIKAVSPFSLSLCASGAGLQPSRRKVIQQACAAAAVAFSSPLVLPVAPARATGLLDCPPRELHNTYYLVRAGQSTADEQGILQTHPIATLSVDSGLTRLGMQQVERAVEVLRDEMGVTGGPGVVLWHDISRRASQTAIAIAEGLSISQESIVPEYSFLVPRGVGLWEGYNATVVLPSMYAADARDWMWTPPGNDDGTPNESVERVFTRIRQLFSKLETQYSGQTIILVASDSDCLSIAQAFFTGYAALPKHSQYFHRQGEVRWLKPAQV
jgi:broad specificity phosphatase PhoE